ncbi:hypothetical protein [Mycoplana rhizolycopersici]|jgi:hypothetical protein|uniref:Uncharacterized protein n=1 Tax=Mycoplana rhizolycopersici TaxID=2746702 RepID=A0ABX2QQC8_9HYPH|nr:hypothetical protein [Rhizobium rhizolycopersici]NVP58514.1 hypothetical protein [Rhizobium rhizolycopersici]
MSDFPCSPASARPDDLARLQELFDTLCLKGHISRHSAVADEVARRIMLLYQAGVRDKATYLAIIATERKGADHSMDICRRGSVLH